MYSSQLLILLLSTSPLLPITHWKQTIIVLPTQIEVEVEKKCRIRRSRRNRRFTPFTPRP